MKSTTRTLINVILNDLAEYCDRVFFELMGAKVLARIEDTKIETARKMMSGR